MKYVSFLIDYMVVREKIKIMFTFQLTFFTPLLVTLCSMSLDAQQAPQKPPQKSMVSNVLQQTGEYFPYAALATGLAFNGALATFRFAKDILGGSAPVSLSNQGASSSTQPLERSWLSYLPISLPYTSAIANDYVDIVLNRVAKFSRMIKLGLFGATAGSFFLIIPSFWPRVLQLFFLGLIVRQLMLLRDRIKVANPTIIAQQNQINDQIKEALREQEDLLKKIEAQKDSQNGTQKRPNGSSQGAARGGIFSWFLGASKK